ncbi:hypothetical protein PEX2_060400 [Penicillium expansum]|uniref:Uncharacterized protein n=1 Tax=Penicillium expansum TaxID=27334 RepID=A0A0A2JFH6_PENEN|nr:hypothetical protein PEX2_060400 [Penicillium expansum]KGO53433.1 hypothetical protein PEX2_060400 [Penicillium expansum]
MNKFARKMDTNVLYYVASVLSPRIKSSLIGTQMNAPDVGMIISQVREFLKKEYPYEPSMCSRPPAGYFRDYVEDSSKSIAVTADASFRH